MALGFGFRFGFSRGGGPLFSLDSLFSSTDSNYLYSYDADSYYFVRGLDDGTYWGMGFQPETSLGYTITAMKKSHVCIPYKSIAQGDVSVSRVGTWGGPFAGVGFYGGEYFRTSETDAYWEYTTPDDITAVGQRGYHVTNAGIVKVLIDGDATKADLITTAQELVDSGVLTSTALVANGGTLDPTDRVLDMYDTLTYKDQMLPDLITDTRVMFSTTLSPEVHIVKVICTGYKNTSSSDVRLYATGVTYFGDGVVSPETPGIFTPVNGRPGGLYSVSNVGAESVYEYVFKPVPSGATGDPWVGNGHGYDEQVGGLVLTLDSIPTSLPLEDNIVTGATVSVERTSQLFHPEIGSGATPIADVVTTYDLAGNGLQVSPEITWLVNGTQDGGYVNMYPTGSWSDTGANAEYLNGTPVNLTDDDGTFKAVAISNLVYMWNSTSNYVASLYSPTPANAGGDYNPLDIITGNEMSIEDRLGGDVNKIYTTRTGFTDGSAISINDVWDLSAMYMMTYLNNMPPA